jgi:hypothetical protein
MNRMIREALTPCTVSINVPKVYSTGHARAFTMR